MELVDCLKQILLGLGGQSETYWQSWSWRQVGFSRSEVTIVSTATFHDRTADLLYSLLSNKSSVIDLFVEDFHWLCTISTAGETSMFEYILFNFLLKLQSTWSSYSLMEFLDVTCLCEREPCNIPEIVVEEKKFDPVSWVIADECHVAWAVGGVPHERWGVNKAWPRLVGCEVPVTARVSCLIRWWLHATYKRILHLMPIIYLRYNLILDKNTVKRSKPATLKRIES